MESVNTRQMFKFLHNHLWPNNQITPGPDGSNTNHWFDLTTFIGCMDTHTHTPSHYLRRCCLALLSFMRCQTCSTESPLCPDHPPPRETNPALRDAAAACGSYLSVEICCRRAGSEDAKGGFVCGCVAFMDHSVDTDLQHGVTVCPASSPGHQDGATWFSSLTVSSDVLLHLPLVSISI